MQINSIGLQQSMKNTPNFMGKFKHERYEGAIGSDSSGNSYSTDYYKYFPCKGETAEEIQKTVDTFTREHSYCHGEGAEYNDITSAQCDVQKPLSFTKEDVEFLETLIRGKFY